MNRRLLGVLAVALLIATGASVIFYQLLSRRFAPGSTGPSREVLVALRDLPPGSVLQRIDLRTVKVSGYVPRGAISDPEKAIGRGLTALLRAGDFIDEEHLAQKGAGAGLAIMIPAGKRAIAMKVDEVVGLAGFVQPGMKVDVLACGEPPEKDKRGDLGTQSRTILQNIEVLSAGQNMEPDKDGKAVTVQVVNLLVSPAEAEILSLAGRETKIQLVLRNPADTEIAQTPGTTKAYLFAGRPSGTPVSAPPQVRQAIRKTAPAPPPPPQMEKVTVPVTMEIYSGAKREEVKVGETEEERVRDPKRAPAKEVRR